MITDKYIFFWGGTYSQWCPSLFVIDGVEYNCAEQYMMAKKALLFGDYESLEKIMNSNSPKDQKQFGKEVKGFDKATWETYCKKYVEDANYAKFTQNKKMLDELIDSGNRKLVEASPQDKIWGIGMAENHPDILDESKWKGTNWLGEAIMVVRTRILRGLY